LIYQEWRDIKRLFDLTVKEFGKIDFLVNNVWAIRHTSDASDYVTGQTIFVHGG
jgi:NAD(P)-dependent dehydrogenase (short-subunit alcohol dehydrogenase family)